MKQHTKYCLSVQAALKGSELATELTCDCPDEPMREVLTEVALAKIAFELTGSHFDLSPSYAAVLRRVARAVFEEAAKIARDTGGEFCKADGKFAMTGPAGITAAIVSAIRAEAARFQP